MAMRSKIGALGKEGCLRKPKKTRQGFGKNTKYATTSRNGKRKSIVDKVYHSVCIHNNVLSFKIWKDTNYQEVANYKTS